MYFKTDYTNPSAKFLEVVLKKIDGNYVIAVTNQHGFGQNYRASEIVAYMNKYLDAMQKKLGMPNTEIELSTPNEIGYAFRDGSKVPDIGGIVIKPPPEITDEKMDDKFMEAHEAVVNEIGDPEIHSTPKNKPQKKPTSELRGELGKFTKILGPRETGWKIP